MNETGRSDFKTPDSTQKQSRNEAIENSNPATDDVSLEGSPTGSDIIEDLRRLEEEYGDNIINSKYMNSQGRFSVNECVAEFGSWENTLEAAGIDKRSILLSDIATVWRALGREPKTTDLKGRAQFSSGIYTSYFGSWKAAKEQCQQKYDFQSGAGTKTDVDTNGGNPSSSSAVDETQSREELISEIQRLETEIGDKVINSRHVVEQGEYSVNEYVDEFGSWSEALAVAGVDRKEVILEEIARVWHEVGEQPTTTQMNKHSEIGSGIYTSEFDSWADAVGQCQAAYDVLAPSSKVTLSDTNETEEQSTDTEQTPEAPSRSELLSELHRLENKLDRLVKATDLPEHSEFTQAQYEAEFGSWDEALSAADINKKEALLDELERVWIKNGGRPSTTDMNQHGAYSAGMYNRFFGSWTEAIAELTEARQPSVSENTSNDSTSAEGVSTTEETSSDEPTRTDLITKLKRLYDQLGNKVANSRHVSNGAYSVHDYTQEFGTWDEALEAAEIDREAVFLDELATVWRELGEEPSTSQMRKYGDLGAGLYSQQFGSWSAAKEKCQQRYDVPGTPSEEASSEGEISLDGESKVGENDSELVESLLDDVDL